MADRDRYYGDPNFVKIPTRELLSKDYAALRRGLIEKERASLAQQPGDPSNMKAVLASAVQTVSRASAIPPIERANDTTCVDVIDKDGNLFSTTQRRLAEAVVGADTRSMANVCSRHDRQQQLNVVAPGSAANHPQPDAGAAQQRPFMVLSTLKAIIETRLTCRCCQRAFGANRRQSARV